MNTNHTHNHHCHDDGCCHCHDEHTHHHHNCSCGTEHADLGKKDLYIFALSLIAFVMYLFLNNTFLAIAAIIICGAKIYAHAVKSLAKLKFNENTLILIAVISTVLMREFAEGYIITLLFGIGQYLEEYSVQKSRKKIENLIANFSEKANDEHGNSIDPHHIKVGDKLLLKPGDKLCVDARILSGSSSFDTSALTGESLPQDAHEGDNLLSGTVNLTNSVLCVAVSEFNNSTSAKIRDYVTKAADQKSKTEKFITSFARIYTPFVIGTAFAIAIVLCAFGITGTTEAIRRALTFMIASCPCALVISIPLAYYAAVGSSGKKGILIKGSKYINLIAKSDTIAFDKTGTLTKGKMSVEKIDCEDWIDKDSALYFASSVEMHSSHPIAEAICNSYTKERGSADNIKETFGKGISATLDGKQVHIGNYQFIIENGLANASQNGINLYIDRKKACVIHITDTVKSDAKKCFENLKKLGIKTICILSGDNELKTQKLKNLLDADFAKGALLPNDKAGEIENMKNSGRRVIFVGDGVNDAPSLASADVSISVATGSALAMETGDITLVSDSLNAIPYVIKVSKYAMKVIYTNIVFSLAVKLAVLVCAALGMAPMWLALFADVGVMLLTTLNSLSVIKR